MERTAELTKTNLKLQKEVEERKQAEKNKEILLKEIHHRVKNNMQIILSLLKMQARQIDDDKLMKFYKDSQDRIYSMGLVHEQLYQSKDLSRIDFKGYVKKLVHNLQASFDQHIREIVIKIDIKDVYIDIDIAIPCGLIINELVSNAFKYAFTKGKQGTLQITMHPKNDMVELVIKDNGIGMADTDSDKTKKINTLGIKLVQNLVEHQLSGEINMAQNQGTEYKICFNNSTRG